MRTNHCFTRPSTWLALISLGLLAGCSLVGEPPVESDVEVDDADSELQRITAEPTEPIVFHDHVYELELDDADRLRIDGDHRLSVDIDDAGPLADRQHGDVIYIEDRDFWLYIDDVEVDGHRLELRGSEPELTDIVERGEFEAEIPATLSRTDDGEVLVEMNDGDIAQAQQQLVDGDREIASANWGYDFADEEALEIDEGWVTAELLEASVELGVLLTVSWSVNFDNVEFGVHADGDAELAFEWFIEAEESFNLNRHIPEFRLADPYIIDISYLPQKYTVDPYLSGQLGVSGHGEGEFNQRFTATGMVEAGVKQQVLTGSDTTPYYDHGLTTTNNTDGDGAINADIAMALDIGIAVREGEGTDGDKMADLIPLSSYFDASAEVDVPDCPWDVNLDLEAYVETYGPNHFWDHSYLNFSDSGDLPMSFCETAPGECSGDSDCDSFMYCSSDNVCEPDADVDARLSWTTEADLGLYVELPDGTVVSHDNPNATDAQLVQSSCGGCGDDDSDQSVQFDERIVFDGADSGDQVRIWIVNNEPGGIDQDIGYNLHFTHQNVFDESYYGTIEGYEGSRSVTYQYRVP